MISICAVFVVLFEEMFFIGGKRIVYEKKININIDTEPHRGGAKYFVLAKADVTAMLTFLLW